MAVALYFAVLYFYRSQTKLREGNVFTPVYHSVHRGRRVCPPHGCRHPPPNWVQNPPGCRPPLCRRPSPQDTWYSTGYSQQAGGTHPFYLICSYLLSWCDIIVIFCTETRIANFVISCHETGNGGCTEKIKPRSWRIVGSTHQNRQKIWKGR